jgi:hypothetical protein
MRVILEAVSQLFMPPLVIAYVQFKARGAIGMMQLGV